MSTSDAEESFGSLKGATAPHLIATFNLPIVRHVTFQAGFMMAGSFLPYLANCIDSPCHVAVTP
jgi:hypothetical protein